MGMLAVVATMVAAAVVNDGPKEPLPRKFDDVPQSSSATSNGIQLEVVGAAFSGTQTLLRMRAAVVDRDALPNSVGDGEIRMVVAAPDGFRGDFGEGRASTGRARSGDLLVTLPAIVPREGYTGEIEFIVEEVVLTLDSGPFRLEGEWKLTLRGPAPDKVAGALRVEGLTESRFLIAGHEVVVVGVRSTSETRVTVTLPSGTQMITQPLLVVGGERIGPQSFNGGDAEVIASFMDTPFESDVTIELGAIVEVRNGEVPPLSVDFGAALARSPGGSTEFRIGAEDIVSGPAELVLGGEQGSYGLRRWVAVVVAGNWHPEDGTPALFDAEGRQLDRAHVQVGYRKTIDGTVTQGTTSIAAFVDKVSEVGLITIVLGGSSEIISQGERVTLGPE